MGELVLYASGVFVLNNAWYKDYPRSRFHWFNDNKEWLQVDKAGHAYGAYQLALQNAWLLRQTGLNRKQAAWVSSGIAWGSMATIEIFDGHSKEWGASWGDLIANSLGTATFLSQELCFDRQIVQIKYGYKPSPYADKYPEKLGSTRLEHFLKDYNAQSYWLSASISEMLNSDKIPPWLAIAVGYGAGGMTSAMSNNDSNTERYRQFMLAPDINWEKIPSKRKSLKILFRALNMIKIPMPALSLQKNKIVGVIE